MSKKSVPAGIRGLNPQRVENGY